MTKAGESLEGLLWVLDHQAVEQEVTVKVADGFRVRDGREAVVVALGGLIDDFNSYAVTAPLDVAKR